MRNIVGIKMSNSFLDVLGKVEEDVKELKGFNFDTITVLAPFVIQLQQVKGASNDVGMAPNLVPLNMFSGDLKEESITLKKEDILFVFQPDENLENFYRASIGDVTVSSQKVYMP